MIVTFYNFLKREQHMTIYIDADVCPVTRIAEDIARKH